MSNQPDTQSSSEIPHERMAHLGEQFQVIARWEVIGERSEPTLVSIFTVPPRPLSADAIRRLPLGSVLAGMRRDLAWEGKVGVGTESDQGRRRRAVARSATGPQRGSALSSDDLQAVSEAYRRAWREGRPVTVAIAEQFHIAPSTAAKRIMAARRAGLLDGVGPRVTR